MPYWSPWNCAVVCFTELFTPGYVELCLGSDHRANQWHTNQLRGLAESKILRHNTDCLGQEGTDIQTWSKGSFFNYLRTSTNNVDQNRFINFVCWLGHAAESLEYRNCWCPATDWWPVQAVSRFCPTVAGTGSGLHWMELEDGWMEFVGYIYLNSFHLTWHLVRKQVATISSVISSWRRSKCRNANTSVHGTVTYILFSLFSLHSLPSNVSYRCLDVLVIHQQPFFLFCS